MSALSRMGTTGWEAQDFTCLHVKWEAWEQFGAKAMDPRALYARMLQNRHHAPRDDRLLPFILLLAR